MQITTNSTAGKLLDGHVMENMLEAFLSGTANGFLIMDASCNVVTLNAAYNHFHERIANNTAKVGVDYRTLLIDTPLQFLQLHVQQSLQGQAKKFAQQFALNENDCYWYDFEFNPLKNKDSIITGVGITVIDTTKQQRDNEKLKRSEELFKALVVNSTDVFQLTDDELKVKYVSDSVAGLLGYETDEITGSHFFNLIHPDDKIVISSWLHWLVYNPGIVKPVELRIRRKAGEWTYIEINGRNMLGVTNIDAIVMNYKDIQAKKIADNALAMAEQRMSLLLNNTKESFIIVNSRLRIITYNRAAQEHSPFFFTQELQSGLSMLELIDVNDVEETINMFEKVFDGLETEKETVYTDTQGMEHVYNHAYRPLFSEDDIVGVFITSTNITARKKAEEKLRSSEERNRTIIQESFDAMLIKDHRNMIMEASPAVEKILGYTVNELIGKICYDIIEEESRESTQQLVNDVMAAPDNEGSVDIVMTHKNGSDVWVEMKAKNMHHNKLINGMIILLRDITVRKHAEDIVSLSEQRFKGLVQSGADIISIIDEEGFVKYSSPTVTTVLGNDPQNDIGKNVFDYIHEADKKRIVDDFDNMLRDGTRLMRFEPYRFPNSRGQYRWLETVVTNLSDDPAVRGIVINSRDVTETKKLNEEQKALTNELIRNNQDLQQFSFITSHNLRAPVANLMSLLSLYDKENILEPFNQVLIGKFEQSTEQLNNTLNDLLEVLVLKSNADIPTESLTFSDTVHLVRVNLENLFKEQQVKLVTDFDEADYIEYNKIHLESIFQNLISNAIKYSVPDRDIVIKISSAIHENWIVVNFEDNGMGIDLERYKDRMFGMYQRFHTGKEGKGLGLYMIKAQLSAMGGKIEVESEKGKGTIFKVYFKK